MTLSPARRRLLDEADRCEPARYLPSDTPSAKGDLWLIVQDLARGERLTVRQSRIVANGIARCLEGQPFKRAFGITASNRSRSRRPYAMAVDAMWRQEAGGLRPKAARAATAALFGLRGKSPDPSAVRGYQATHRDAIEREITMQMTHFPGMTRAEALAAVRYDALMDAALDG